MCKVYIGPIRMVEEGGGGEGKRISKVDGMKGGGDTERALRGNGRWGKMERESKDKCGKRGKMKGRSERKRQV